MQQPEKIPVQERMPDPWSSVRVWLPDGTLAHATWTGKVWWAGADGELHPTHWAEMPNQGLSC